MSVSNITNMLRISGMSSGLDTESMVTSLMQIEKLKVSRVAQQKTLLEWRKDSHRSINKLLQTFRETTMSVLSPETNLFSASAFRTAAVTMSPPSSAVTITAGVNALLGPRTIEHIDTLASSAKASGTASLTGGTGLATASTLSDLSSTLGLTFGGELSDTLSFEINGESFRFKSSDTLATVFNTINNSKAGVTIAYTELTDRIFMSTKATGASTEVRIGNTEGNLFGTASAIGITADSYQNGTDASLRIDGVDITRSSNTFTIDGATYALKSTSASSVAFQITRDVEPAVARIKSFVTLYNELVGKLQDVVGEDQYTDFPPLTDDQRQDMSEAEIETWETKAKSGLLRHDRDLNSLLSQMRGMLYETVKGVGKSLSDIGIKTGAYYDGGKITIDETKLTRALNEDPDAVMNLFTQTTTTSTQTSGVVKGFLPRLMEGFSAYTSCFSVAKADEDIAKLGTRISELNDDLSIREESYWKRFSAMEEALSTMQSQSTWLTQQFSQ